MGLAQLAKRHGNEPVNIIEVDWIAGQAPASYADKDVQGIPGKIVELGDLDDVVAHIIAESGVTNSDTSQQIDVTLDDIDGSIKTIFDSYDVHKRLGAGLPVVRGPGLKRQVSGLRRQDQYARIVERARSHRQDHGRLPA